MHSEVHDPMEREPLTWLADTLGRCYFRLDQDADGILIATWSGYASPDMVRAALQAVQEANPPIPTHLLIHDSRQALGSWRAVIPYILGQNLTDLKARMPVAHAAAVIARSGFSSDSAQALFRLFPQNRNYRFRLFYDLDRARSWLLRLPVHTEAGGGS